MEAHDIEGGRTITSRAARWMATRTCLIVAAVSSASLSVCITSMYVTYGAGDGMGSVCNNACDAAKADVDAAGSCDMTAG